VLKACHPLFIKLHEIGYLGFIWLEIHGSLDDKSRILDKIEKRLTKMSWGIDKRYLGAEAITLRNGPALSGSVQLKRAKARAKIQRHVSLF
jgi:hypothetical protein